MTTDELERRLTGGLRETLDRELGPDPTWAGSPAARRAAELHRSRRWRPLRVLAVAAVLGAAVGAALLAGALEQPEKVANGWIAYSALDPAGGDPDTDIWFTALDQQPRRVIGTDTDGVDQACPAFSPDGRHLAYGTVEGLWSTGSSPVWPAYRNAALVIANVAEDGTVADEMTLDVGDGVAVPCPVWSTAGDHLAFGVPLTSPINPLRSGEGSEVWVLRPGDGHVSVIPNMLATDIEWSPDGSVLAIAGGVDTATHDHVDDAQLHLYELSTGSLRTLGDTLGITHLTWSPDGSRIGYAHDHGDRQSLRVIDVESGRQEALTGRYRAVHGVGPVWSPDGSTILYQRAVASERHEVVLLTPDDRSAQTGLATEVAMPMERTTVDGSTVELFPWRVTWSPDGAYLLYVAWTYLNECCHEGTVEQTWVVAVPTDPDAPALVLSADPEPRAMAYDSEDTMRVPIQVWGRR